MIIDEWRDITKNIKADIRVLDMPILDTSKNKELLWTVITGIVLGLLSYVAKQERTFINQRQREGIDIALSKGVNFGRPKIEKPHNFDDVVFRWKNKDIKKNNGITKFKTKYFL